MTITKAHWRRNLITFLCVILIFTTLLPISAFAYLQNASASVLFSWDKYITKPDEGSVNAFVPFTVVNTRGFDLPQTGGMGNWMFPVFGLSAFALCVFAIFALCRKKKVPTSK